MKHTHSTPCMKHTHSTPCNSGCHVTRLMSGICAYMLERTTPSGFTRVLCRRRPRMACHLQPAHAHVCCHACPCTCPCMLPCMPMYCPCMLMLMPSMPRSTTPAGSPSLPPPAPPHSAHSHSYSPAPCPHRLASPHCSRHAQA